MTKILSLILIVFACQSAIGQCMMKQIPLSNRTTNSALIIEGKVVSKTSFWNAAHNMIYTSNIVEVYKVFKGNLTTTSIEILTMGGTVDYNRITVEPSLSLKPGDIGVFTCENVKRFNLENTNRTALPQYEAYASSQGFIRYDLNSQTASDPFYKYNNIETELYSAILAPGLNSWITVKPFDIHASGVGAQKGGQPIQVQAISGFAPTSVSAGTGSTITITGTGFGATQGSGTVGFKNGDDGGATYINPLASQYISWSNTQIVVEVPSGAGTGNIQVTQGTTQTSSGVLTVNYAHLKVDFDPGPGTIAYGTDHIDDNGSGGYTWRMNTGFDGNASAKASFMRAFDTWRCNTGVNWTIGATSSINDAVSDGTNIICFDNTAPLSDGILGVCYSYWSGCASGPTIAWYVSELDIIFDEGSNISPLTWEYGTSAPSGSEYDFETVAVHELGHGHQLGHVISPGAIMHYSIGNGSSNRSLGVNDLAGGNYVQSKSTVANVCGPGPMTNHSCGTPPVASFSASPTTLCAGGTVSFTDLSTNTPTVWAWTFPGGTPSSSSAQNPTITYNTPGVYSVTLTATNAFGSDPVSITSYITVNSIPTINASASSTNVCSGTTTTLTASGGTSYLWNTGATTSVINVSPTTNTTYTVTGTSSGCSGTDVITISTTALPNVNISGTSTLCTGTSSVLTGSGALSYLWNTGATTSNISVSPSSLTVYTLTGTDASGCSKADTHTVNPIACGSETITTSLHMCNLKITSTNYPVYANQVAGATAYRFSFYNPSAPTVTVASLSSPTRSINISNVSGLYYGNVYKWTVAVNRGQGFGPESSGTCTLTIDEPKPTIPCGITVTNMASPILSTSAGSISGYKFTFYDNTTNALVTTKTQASNYLYLNQVSNIAIGNTYKVTVQVQYNNGTALVYSTPSNSLCTITIGAPKAVLPCGKTYTSTTIPYTGITSVSGVSAYRVNCYNMSTSALVGTKTFSTNYVYIKQIPGLVYNNSYYWTIECQYNNGTGLVFGPASTNTCVMTWGTPSSVILDGNDISDAASKMVIDSEEEDEIVVNVYPNPNQGIFTVDLPSDRHIEITNILGEKVADQLLLAGQNIIDINSQANGIYFLKIINNNKQQVVKIIKGN
ncbi:MAG: PKD domain-containing protein [Bacteroidia bacterium]|nr:PKD domain-containing protein [Bacteroidia bacterium]